MKKVLLVTWIDSYNYGSILQAYCLKNIIESVGTFGREKHSDEIEVYLLNHHEIGESRLKRIHGIMLKDFLQKIENKIWRFYFKGQIMSREQKFDAFKTEMLNLYPKQKFSVKDSSDLKTIDKFDLYVAGSDQIWNPKLLSWIYLLDWAPKDRPKISYAASVCVDHLDTRELERYKPLAKFETISVREYTEAVRQISEFVNKKITEVVDPVILFGRKEMLKRCRETFTEEYMLVYMLRDNIDVRGYYSRLARQNQLKLRIIPYTRVNNLLSEMKLAKNFEWGADPLDFVNLIYNSKVLVTDSYHGVITALLLHKDFILIPRDVGPSQQNNRLISLLEKVGLADRIGVKPEKIEEIVPINWNDVDKKLEKLRKQSMDYLAKTLDSAGLTKPMQR